MDFTLLKSFIAVADERSMSGAAKHLFISQQSLSKQMAKLEEELGTTLFVRSRPLGLTPDGVRFFQVAKEILQLKQQYEESSSKGNGGTQYIQLGIEHTVARAVLPHVLPPFVEQHPDVFVKLAEESPAVLQKAVTHEGLDLVIGSISNTPDNYETVELCKKDHILVVPKRIMHELAGDDYDDVCKAFSLCADLRYFENAPFIKIPSRSSGGRALQSYIDYYDINPHFVCELTNVENAFQLANGGLGVFVYAKIFWDLIGSELQKDYLENIEVFPLMGLPDIESINAYYHKERGIHGVTEELLDTFRSFFESYTAGNLEQWGIK
jgi:DNA-binding transcriptional LysR family regulator